MTENLKSNTVKLGDKEQIGVKEPRLTAHHTVILQDY